MKTNTSLPHSRRALARKVLLVVAGLPLLGFACAGVAQAGGGTVTQTQTITARSTDFTSSTNFNLFNPSLGTLTEVDWTVAISGNVNGTVTNNAPSAQDFTINETTTFKTTGPTRWQRQRTTRV